MSNAYTIDKVAWHTNTPGNPEPRAHIVRRFHSIAKFLLDNGLLIRDITTTESEMSDSFEINSGDLTEEGMTLIKAAYDKWLGRVDKGASPEDITILVKTLKRIRDA